MDIGILIGWRPLAPNIMSAKMIITVVILLQINLLHWKKREKGGERTRCTGETKEKKKKERRRKEERRQNSVVVSSCQGIFVTWDGGDRSHQMGKGRLSKKNERGKSSKQKDINIVTQAAGLVRYN
jgi:mannitol-specific phosphotransferase system IIBC component